MLFHPIIPIYMLLHFAQLFPPWSKCPSDCCKLLFYLFSQLLSKDGYIELVQSVFLVSVILA